MIGEVIIAVALIVSAGILSGTALHIFVKVDKNGAPYPPADPLAGLPENVPPKLEELAAEKMVEPVPTPEPPPRTVDRHPTPLSDDPPPEEDTLANRRRGMG